MHIGIVTYNSLADLPACFAGISAQTYAPVHVTVLDNASTDGSPDWVRMNAPTARLLLNPANAGFGAGHNRIIAACGLQPGDYYLALNPDVQMDADYIKMIVRAISEDNRIGWATGKLLWGNDNGLSSVIYSAGHGLLRGGYAFNIGHGMQDESAFCTSREVFGASGAAVVIKHALIADLAAGGEVYDESMFLYGEDSDLDWRARLRGWVCWYIAEAEAQHRYTPPDPEYGLLTVAHRYISVIKNAYPADLLFYNLPLMGAHCLLRLLTPRDGIRLLRIILRYAPSAWRKRRRPAIMQREMHQWFRWSSRQPTGQPASLIARLRAFVISSRANRVTARQ